MTDFKVKKGRKFFRGPRWNFFGIKKKEFNVKAYFWGDCVYRLNDNYDQINKLTGQSFRILPWYDKVEGRIRPGHHKYSVRFGWRCIDGESIEILAYAYINGNRKSKKLLEISLDEWVHLNFKETEYYYTFKIIRENGESSIAKFAKITTKKGFLGLFINRLYPYFGGRVAAPNNMTISLKYLKKFV